MASSIIQAIITNPTMQNYTINHLSKTENNTPIIQNYTMDPNHKSVHPALPCVHEILNSIEYYKTVKVESDFDDEVWEAIETKIIIPS